MGDEAIRYDPLSAEQRERTMRSVHSKDTETEMRVRRLVHRMGYRYRLHRADLPGKPDLVFPARRKIIFINGCFWHGHDCKSGRKRPKTNVEYWSRKLERNKGRDQANYEALCKAGWEVLIVWECELANPDCLAQRVRSFLDGVER
jgi:DNA mismatch endonuclease (patch repair protein)